MLNTTGCRRIKSVAIAIAVVLALPACTVEAGDEAAHAIAEKFAAEDTSNDSADLEISAPDMEVAEAESLTGAQREADEAEMLARARAEAEERRKAGEERHLAEEDAKKQAERAAEVRRQAEERRRAEAARAAAEKAEAERRARAQREADEAEMLARARAEAEARRRAQAAKAAAAEKERLRARALAEEKRQRAARLAEEERQRAAVQAKRLAEIAEQEEARKAEEARRMAEEERRKKAEYWRRFEEEQRRKAAEAKRRAEAAAQDEKRRAAEARRQAALRQLEEESRRRAEQAEAIAALAAAEKASKAKPDRRSREPRQLADSPRQTQEQQEQGGKPYPSPRGLGGPRSAGPSSPDRKQRHPWRVTVLLVMDPGHRGIRRFNETADPILCVGTRCYISEGPDEPARALTRRRAFGPVVALGTRAGRCRRSLTCVFRAVDLEQATAVVQPIDLRILRHDRREPRAAAADPTCRVDGERLTCSRPIIASNYKLWMVPESVAESAGAFALELAVRAGLPDESSIARAEEDRR